MRKSRIACIKVLIWLDLKLKPDLNHISTLPGVHDTPEDHGPVFENMLEELGDGAWDSAVYT